jgi:hypothetical protein
VTVAQRDLMKAVQTLTSEGEAPTAARVATHIALTYRDADPSADEVQEVLDALVRQGRLRSWRVFATTGEYHTDADWLTAYVPSE